MTTVYLIDIDDFTRRADLSKNINTDKIKAQIGITQEKYAVKMLCQDLYDLVISQYPNGLSPANEALLPYIQDFLVYKTYARYLVSANAHSQPGGMFSMNDSAGTKLTPEEMAPIIAQAQGDANFYQTQLQNFLVKNEDDYPLWKDSICQCGRNRRPVNLNRFSKVGSKGSETQIRWT